MGNFEVNQAGLDRVLAEATATAQARMNSAVDIAVSQVREGYGGESADEVYEQLVAALDEASRSTFGGGVQIDELALRRFASSIVHDAKAGA
jgi:hypothetical protein